MVAPPAQRPAVQLQSLFAALCTLCRSAFLPLQDQPADIRAWVDYHYALGIPRVYLFDNNSTIPLSSALQDHIDDGIVQCELPRTTGWGCTSMSYRAPYPGEPPLWIGTWADCVPSGAFWGQCLVAKVCPSHAPRSIEEPSDPLMAAHQHPRSGLTWLLRALFPPGTAPV